MGGTLAARPLIREDGVIIRPGTTDSDAPPLTCVPDARPVTGHSELISEQLTKNSLLSVEIHIPTEAGLRFSVSGAGCRRDKNSANRAKKKKALRREPECFFYLASILL